MAAVPSAGARGEFALEVGGDAGPVSSLLLRPERAIAGLALAHGAGAGMRHSFMEAVAERLAARRIATLRYQFPYMERGSGAPDPPARLTATVRAAVAAAMERLGGLPIFAGGKSLGGRMTSTAQSEAPLAGVLGLAFFGFPLHPPGRPGTSRARHLDEIRLPMLFLQGTRDTLAEIELLRPVCDRLGPRAELRIIEGADHSFHVLKRSGRTDEQALDELAGATQSWMERALAAPLEAR